MLISIAPKPHFPDILFTMDMTKILNITSISKVVIKMRSQQVDLEVKISLLNRDRSCHRPLSENNMLFAGDDIIQFSNSEKDRVYFLELRYGVLKINSGFDRDNFWLRQKLRKSVCLSSHLSLSSLSLIALSGIFTLISLSLMP